MLLALLNVVRGLSAVQKLYCDQDKLTSDESGPKPRHGHDRALVIVIEY